MYPIVFFLYLSYLYIVSVVINGGGKDWAVIIGGANVIFSFTVISNFNVKLSCLSICILCSWISLRMSCR